MSHHALPSICRYSQGLGIMCDSPMCLHRTWYHDFQDVGNYDTCAHLGKCVCPASHTPVANSLCVRIRYTAPPRNISSAIRLLCGNRVQELPVLSILYELIILAIPTPFDMCPFLTPHISVAYAELCNYAPISHLSPRYYPYNIRPFHRE